MTTQEIKSIIEAYSMQPNCYYVVEQEKYDTQQDEEYRKYLIKEIKLSQVDLPTGENYSVYIGYNFEGKQIFQYKADSVNVYYKP